MQKIIVYGAGGLGREVLQMARDFLSPQGAEILGFVDDGVEPGTVRNDAPVLGGIRYLEEIAQPVSVLLGLADPPAKARIYNRLRQNGNISFPSFIHPRALVRAYTTIGEGAIVTADCHLSINVSIGKCVLLNDATMIGHDVSVGDFTSIMPLVAVSGNIRIGERTLIGVHTAIRQGLTIGSDCTIGMGSIVTRDVPDGTTALGNPARARA